MLGLVLEFGSLRVFEGIGLDCVQGLLVDSVGICTLDNIF